MVGQIEDSGRWQGPGALACRLVAARLPLAAADGRHAAARGRCPAIRHGAAPARESRHRRHRRALDGGEPGAAAQCLTAACVDLLPLPDAAPRALAPSLLLVRLLLLDRPPARPAAAAGPCSRWASRSTRSAGCRSGLTALGLLLARRRCSAAGGGSCCGRPLLVVWAGFVLRGLAVACVRWAAGCRCSSAGALPLEPVAARGRPDLRRLPADRLAAGASAAPPAGAASCSKRLTAPAASRAAPCSLGGAQVAFFGALAARLYHLQVERSAEFALLAEDNRANQRLLVPPRGRILDRLGRPLARNVPTYRMLVIREQARDLRPLLERLAALVDPGARADRCRAAEASRATARLRAAAGARGSELGRGGAPRRPFTRASGRGARFRPAARLSRRLGARPCAGLCRRGQPGRAGRGRGPAAAAAGVPHRQERHRAQLRSRSCAAAPGSAGSRSTPSAARSASSTGARACPAPMSG